MLTFSTILVTILASIPPQLDPANQAAEDGAARGVSQVSQILDWLPPDTSTVVVNTQPGKVNLKKDTGPLAEFASILALIGLPTWSNFKYEFVVHGARHSRDPKELGLSPYDGCDVLGMQKDEYKRMLAHAEKYSVRRGLVGGMTVYVFEEPMERDKWTYYFAFADGLMFCATSKAYFSELFQRRAHASDEVAFPQTLEEWQYIDKDAPLWAIRVIPTDAKQRMKRDLDDGQIVGFAVSMDKLKQRVTVTSISTNPKGYEIAAHLWRGILKNEQAAAPLEVVKVDKRVTRIVLDAQAPHGEAPIFFLIAVLGHPVFL